MIIPPFVLGHPIHPQLHLPELAHFQQTVCQQAGLGLQGDHQEYVIFGFHAPLLGVFYKTVKKKMFYHNQFHYTESRLMNGLHGVLHVNV